MKKIITICVLVASIFVANAQERANPNMKKDIIIKPDKIVELFQYNFSNRIYSNNIKQGQWTIKNNGAFVTLGNQKFTDYLEVNVSPINLQVDVTSFNKILLEIEQELKLTKNVFAEIEVKLNNSNSWIAFEDLTYDFLTFTNGEIGSVPGSLAKYPNEIFKQKYKKVRYNYDKDYKIHIAGIKEENHITKLNIYSDINKIEKIRFRLVRKNSIDIDKMTVFWNIKKIRIFNEIYYNSKNVDLNGGEGVVGEKATSTDGGTCPLPHGH